jgi:quinoprotein glucose dehydrogenase
MPRLPLSVALVLAATASAAPPPAPAGFDQPQTPARPAPFPVTLVDQGRFDPRLKGLFAPAGFQTEIVADAPTVVNPVGLTFAPDGTLFVAEWRPDPGHEWAEFREVVHYRDGTSREAVTMKKFVPDPIKIIRPHPLTGVYDRAETIIAEELPSTLLWHDGWLYTASRGTVRRYRQSRPGGPWDVREVIAQGFCGFHHHQVSGLTIGNDGWLYITSGDDDNVAEGSDGSRATVLRTGAVFRCRPDGSKLETFSIGYRNPYRDLAHDDKFNWFHADNDNEDGSKFTGCRLVHVAEGVDYGWRLAPGARCCRPDFVRGAIAGELPGKLPPMLKTGRGSPAGLLIYHDTKLPEQYRGLHYYPDVFRKVVRAYTIRPAGASFEVTNEFEFLKSDDPLFRPCHMVTGPDGAVYLCDWRTDSGGAGKLWGDGQNGRIYRLKWVGTDDAPAIPLRGMDSWAKLVKLPDAKLVDALGVSDLSDRVQARNELVRRGPKAARAVLKKLVSGTLGPDARLGAVGVLTAHWSPEVEDLFRLLLNDTAADVRRLAADALGRFAAPGDGRTQEALLKLLTDDDPAVKRTAALAVGRLGAAGAGDLLVSAWKTDLAANDPFLTDGYLRGIERLGKPGLDALLSLAHSGEKADLDRVAESFAGFRTRAAADALPELLSNPHLGPTNWAALIRSYTNYQFDPPLSLEPLAAYLDTRPEVVPVAGRVAALEVLAANGVAGPKAAGYVLGLLDAKESEVRLAAVTAVEQARLRAGLPRLLDLLADAKRPAAERVAVLKAVRATGGADAAKPLLALLASPSEAAAFQAEVLRALAAVAPDKAGEAAGKLLDQPDPALIAEAVGVLGATKAGAKLVGERYLAGNLPRDLLPRVSEALKKFAADPAVAGLGEKVMREGLRLSADPAEAERVRRAVYEKGNPQKGKALYLDTKALACATCHKLEGVGGSVGPDLTRVWDTMTVEKLLESIAAPSNEIKEGYQAYKAETADGRVFTGLKVSETATEVVLREAAGTDVRLAKEDLDSLTPSKVSLMPDNAVAQLSYDQVIDLLAFLKNRAAQESLRPATPPAGEAGAKPAAGPEPRSGGSR